MSTMQELIFHPDPTPHTTIHTVPIPTPGPDTLLIKVIHAASNTKDYDHPAGSHTSLNSGDDCSGIVQALGPTTSTRFHPGDRVAAFHPMATPHGTYADYALAPIHTTMHIPASMSFEDASTLPLIAYTAGITLFRRQHLPAPWTVSPSTPPTKTPLIIYGASSALGCLLIHLAKAARLGPLIAIAGGSSAHVASLLHLVQDGGEDVLLDYRHGTEAWMEEARTALEGVEATHAVDCISKNGTWVPLARLVGPGRGTVSTVNGGNRYEESEVKESGARVVYTYVGTVHDGAYRPGMPCQGAEEEVRGDVDWAGEFTVWLEGALERGEVKGHPWVKIAGGLNGVQEGLRRLAAGEAKGSKFIYDVAGQTDH